MLSFDLALNHWASFLCTQIFCLQTTFHTALITHRAITCRSDSASQLSLSRLVAHLLPCGINRDRFDHQIGTQRVVLGLKKSWRLICLYHHYQAKM